jgi:hypothetical protein
MEMSMEKMERGLEPAFLRILSPPYFLPRCMTFRRVAIVSFPMRTLVASSTFHGTASPDEVPDACSKEKKRDYNKQK